MEGIQLTPQELLIYLSIFSFAFGVVIAFNFFPMQTIISVIVFIVGLFLLKYLNPTTTY